MTVLMANEKHNTILNQMKLNRYLKLIKHFVAHPNPNSIGSVPKVTRRNWYTKQSKSNSNYL